MDQKSSEPEFQEKKRNSLNKRGKRKSRSFFSSGITVLSRTTSPSPEENASNAVSGNSNASNVQNSPANPPSNTKSTNSPQPSLSPRKRSSTISSMSEKDLSEVLKSSPNSSPNSKLSPQNREENNVLKFSRIVQTISKKENLKKLIQAQKYARGYLARQMLSFRRQVAKQRKELIEQLYQSEKLYAEALRLIVSHFLVPLRLHTYSGKNLPGNEQRGKQLELQHLRTIFGDIEVILNLSAKLETQLENRIKEWNVHSTVGDLFIQISDYIKLYFTYASNYPKAFQAVQSLRSSTKAFENLLREYQNHTECLSFYNSFDLLLNFAASFQFSSSSSSNDPSSPSYQNKAYIVGGGIDLESLLFAPIERMSQYEFALTELENNTWKEHPDYVTLHKALDKFALSNFSSHLTNLKTSDPSSQTSSPVVKEDNKREKTQSTTTTLTIEEPPSAKLFAQNLFRIHSVKKRLLGKYEELIIPGRSILLEGSVVYSNSFIEPDLSSLGSGSMETTKSFMDQNSSASFSTQSSIVTNNTTNNNTPNGTPSSHSDRSNLTSSRGKGNNNNNNNNGTSRPSIDRDATVSPALGFSSSSVESTSNNSKHSMYIFLFNDIIVFGKLIQLKDTTQSYYKFKKLRSLGVVSVESTVSPVCLRMNIDKKSRYLYFDAESEKKKWLSILNKAIYTFIKLENKKAHQEKIQDIRKSFSLTAFASGSQATGVDADPSIAMNASNGGNNGGVAPRMKRTQSLSKFLSLPKKSSNPVTKGQDISMPYNVRHSLHVDKDLIWSGQDPEAAFEKVELIGEGSYGTVWCIKHKASGALLAAKIIQKLEFSGLQAKQKQNEEHPVVDKPAEDPSSNVYVHEIENEINILRKCKNSNIILMDYCRLGSVRDIMSKTRKTINEEQISQIVQDVLKGLVYLHATGIIHRDLKAGNLLMNELGQVMIADFGVSKITDKTNELIGTPVYMSPEVVLKQGYDNKTDIWSLGIIVIELADGYPPLYKLPPKRAMQMIPIRNPPTVQNTKMWSSNMLNFLSQCLIKDPLKRASAIDLLAHPFVQGAKGHKYTTMKLVQELELMRKHEKYILEMQQQQQQRQILNADSESSANSSRNSLGSVQDNNPVPNNNISLPNDPNLKENVNNAMKPLQILADKLNKVAHQSPKEDDNNNSPVNNHVTHNTLNNINTNPNIQNNKTPANNNNNANANATSKSRSRSVSTPKKKGSDKQLTASVSFEGNMQTNPNVNPAVSGGTLIIKDAVPPTPSPSPVSKNISNNSKIENSTGTIVMNESPSADSESMSTFIPKQNVTVQHQNQVTTPKQQNNSTILSSQKLQRNSSNSNVSQQQSQQQPRSQSRSTTPVPDAMDNLAESIAKNIQVTLEKTLNALAIPEGLKNVESNLSSNLNSQLSSFKDDLLEQIDARLKLHEQQIIKKFEEMIDSRLGDSQSNSRKSPSVWTNSNKKITDFFKSSEGKFNTVQRSHSYTVLRRNRSNSSATVNEKVKLFQGISGNKV